MLKHRMGNNCDSDGFFEPSPPRLLPTKKRPSFSAHFAICISSLCGDPSPLPGPCRLKSSCLDPTWETHKAPFPRKSLGQPLLWDLDSALENGLSSRDKHIILPPHSARGSPVDVTASRVPFTKRPTVHFSEHHPAPSIVGWDLPCEPRAWLLCVWIMRASSAALARLRSNNYPKVIQLPAPCAGYFVLGVELSWPAPCEPRRTQPSGPPPGPGQWLQRKVLADPALEKIKPLNRD